MIVKMKHIWSYMIIYDDGKTHRLKNGISIIGQSLGFLGRNPFHGPEAKPVVDSNPFQSIPIHSDSKIHRLEYIVVITTLIII